MGSKVMLPITASSFVIGITFGELNMTRWWPYVGRPSLYHGDEIEASGDEPTWASKKELRIVKNVGRFSFQQLFFLLELKVENPAVTSFAGVFVDEAEEPVVEIPVSATEYEPFERTIDIKNWQTGIHVIKLKLKSEGSKIYNRLFEIWAA